MKMLIKRMKRECWDKFLIDSNNRDPWEVVAIVKDPFGIRETIGSLEDDDGNLLETQQEKVYASQRHNLITKGNKSRIRANWW